MTNITGREVLFKPDSGNRKIGNIAASYTHRSSCPDTCELKSSGCYADGYPTRFAWDAIGKLNKKGKVPDTHYDWDGFCRQVAALPKHKVFRHNVAGDLPGYDGDNNSIDSDKLRQLNKACSRVQAFTFTHKPVGAFEPGDTDRMHLNRARNSALIKEANESGGISINISSENLSDADRVAALGIGPVVTVVGTDAPRHMKTPSGRHVIVCPNEEDKDRTCDRCLLCANPKRKAIIAFRAHGVKKNAVSKRVSNKVHLQMVS